MKVEAMRRFAAAHWVVGPTTLRSQGRNTPFLGLEVPGRVRHTLVNGIVVGVQGTGASAGREHEHELNLHPGGR